MWFFKVKAGANLWEPTWQNLCAVVYRVDGDESCGSNAAHAERSGGVGHGQEESEPGAQTRRHHHQQRQQDRQNHLNVIWDKAHMIILLYNDLRISGDQTEKFLLVF